MKTRYGFVSNSSASSFLVSALSFKDGEHISKIEIDLKDHIGCVMSTIEELDDWYKDNCCQLPDLSKVGQIIRTLDPPPVWEISRIEEYRKAREDIKSGLKVASGFFSDNGDDSPLAAGLTCGGIPEVFNSVNVIQDCDGY